MTFSNRKRVEKAPPSGEALYQAAVRALSHRARSVNELRVLLQRKKAEAAEIEAVLARLRENGYLDDARYARSFVASRLENEGFGARRVRRDLAARRVHPELAEKALKEGYDAVDERKLLREYLLRKLRLSSPPRKPSALASLYQRLLRAGFASATIVKELQELYAMLPPGARGAAIGSRSGRSSGGQHPEIDPDKWQEWVESLADLPDAEAGTEDPAND